MKLRPAIATLSLVALVGMPALAQSRSERVDQLATMLSSAVNEKPRASETVYTDAVTGEVIRATPAQLMREQMTSVDLNAVPGRLALEIWASQTNVPLVVNWKGLEAQGIDPTSPVTLTLHRVPAEMVLKLIIDQMHPEPLGDDALLIDVQEWFIRVMTRGDALRRSTTKLYFIGDLLMDIPHFENAPNFDLNEALSNTSSGGSNGNGNSGGQGNQLFPDTNDNDNKEERLTKQEKAERIVETIRQTIEPSIWRENGGEYGSIRYFNGMLIVKAPEFVHEQIGGTTGSTNQKAKTRRTPASRSSDNNQADKGQPRSSSGNVAGVAPQSPTVVK